MHTYKDEDIDYVLELLAHPELELTEQFRTWIKEESHHELYVQAKALHDGLGMEELPLPDVQEEWHRFLSHNRISASSQHPSPTIPHRTHSRTSYWLRAAAVVLLLLIAGVGAWFYQQPDQPAPIALMERSTEPQEVTLSNNRGGEIILTSQTSRDSLAVLGATMTGSKELAYQQEIPAETMVSTQTLRTPRGKDFKLVLQDGTEVWLNAESTLTYPSRFTGSERIVQLDGEAYFKVTKDPDGRPFIVKTAKLETQVLGTGFNVRAYSEDASHITLVEGKVAVRSDYSHILLQPGENAQLQSDGTIQVRNVDTQVYTAWTEGYFYFDNASLKEILQEVGRWYNLSVRIDNPKAMDYHFNFWAGRKDNIRQVIDLINELGKVSVSLEENTLIIT